MTPRRGLPPLGRRFFRWGFGLIAAAVGAVIVSGLTGIPNQLLDFDALKDRLRPGSDFSYTADVVYLDDEAMSVAVPGNYQPTAEQVRLMNRLDNVTAPQLARQLRAVGGTDVSDLTLRIVVQGRSNQEVRIVDVRPVVLARTNPADGTLFHVPSQEGAASINMIVDFDEPIPVLRQLNESLTGPATAGRPYFDNNSVRLQDREQDVIVIRAETERRSISFHLEVVYLLGNKQKTAIIDDDGHAFRVTGFSCRPTRPFASYQRVYELTSGLAGLKLAPFPDPGRFPLHTCTGKL